MAAITSANVVIHDTYEIGTRQGKFRAQAVYATITLAAQGGTAGDIPASVFGLKQITYARNLAATIAAAQREVGFQIANYGVDANYIYPVDPAQATDASRGLPSNITGTCTVYLEGIPAA